jgi:ATP-dependent Lon protease
VLPIGGLKEKLLAALRGGIKTVLIPEENVRDLAEIPDIVKEGMEIVPVSRMDQVIERALVRKPEPIEWNFDEATPAVSTTVDAASDDATAGLPH